ncbi:MAG: hypothetical protein ACE5F3_03610 [Mariprofundaceae bacterium]
MPLKLGKVLIVVAMLFFLGGCEQAKEAGNDAARELTGSNMIQQKKVVEKQLQSINRRQTDRLEDIE